MSRCGPRLRASRFRVSSGTGNRWPLVRENAEGRQTFGTVCGAVLLTPKAGTCKVLTPDGGVGVLSAAAISKLAPISATAESGDLVAGAGPGGTEDAKQSEANIAAN